LTVPSVKVLAYTQPTVPDKMGTVMSPEDFISYVARVSNPDNQANTDTAPRLLAYLLKHSHISPFEHTYVTFEITTTRDISRQILRHKFVFQEYSGRYAEMDSEMVERECRLQDTKNRQNSLPTDRTALKNWWASAQNNVWLNARTTYEAALIEGIAKEQARALLPEGLTKTTIIVTGNVRSWLHYLHLRRDPSTQKEHREVAELIWTEMKTLFPVITGVWENLHTDGT